MFHKIMLICIGIALILTGLVSLYLSAVKTTGRDVSVITDAPFAHRGLYNNDDGVPENSMAAFANAIERGYGFELDVRLDGSGNVVVFHDANASRLCGVDADIRQCDGVKVSTFTLCGTDETIPTLVKVLDFTAGRVPILVEIKATDDVTDRLLCEQTAALLDRYGGDFAIQSFNPRIVEWFRQSRPKYLRGLLLENYNRRGVPMHRRVAWSALWYNMQCAPDFLALKYGDRVPAIGLLRALVPMPVVGWTKKDGADGFDRRRYDNIIFENR